MNCGDKILGITGLSAEQESFARARDISIKTETIEIDFVPYEASQTIKRQMFWLCWVSKMLRKNDNLSRILDIGSNLFWLIGISSQYKLDMIDVRRHPLADHFPFNMTIGDAASLPFEHSSFDAVTFPQLLHWMGTAAYGGELDVDADRTALAEIARVMKPDGFGLFVTFVVPRSGVFKIGGRRLYSVEDLKSTVRRAGLEIAEIEYYNPELQQIRESELVAPTGRELVTGNPDEDICWAFLKVTKT